MQASWSGGVEFVTLKAHDEMDVATELIFSKLWRATDAFLKTERSIEVISINICLPVDDICVPREAAARSQSCHHG